MTVGCVLYDSCDIVEEKAIRRAALITLRRAILENFPPGPERDKRLEWLARAVSSGQEAWRALKLLGGRPAHPKMVRRSG